MSSGIWQVLDKDIPSDDLVWHSLELVLHLLQQCLDLGNNRAKVMTTEGEPKSPHINKWRSYSWKILIQLALLQKTNKQKTPPLSCNLPVVYCEASVVSSFPDNGAEVQWVQSLFNEMNKMCWTTRAAIMHFLLFFPNLSYIKEHYDNLYCTYKMALRNIKGQYLLWR